MADKIKIAETFEMLIDDKTYVTKKLNSKRRALVLRELVGVMTGMASLSKEKDPEKISPENVQAGIAAMADIFDKKLPLVGWAFIKDEDKTTIGKEETFVDNWDDANSMKFLQWATAKVNEVNDFLAPKPEVQQS